MANTKQKIENHNGQTISNGRQKVEFTRSCNCRDNNIMHTQRKMPIGSSVHIVTQTESMKQLTYTGMTENHFKTRYNLHNSSFRLPHNRSTTTLSEHLWKLRKDAGVSYKTERTIMDKAKPCSPASRKCDLCLAKKYYIL